MTNTEAQTEADLGKADQILHELEGLAAVVEEFAYATNHPEWSPRSDMYSPLSYIGQSIQRSATDLRLALWSPHAPEKDTVVAK